VLEVDWEGRLAVLEVDGEGRLAVLEVDWEGRLAVLVRNLKTVTVAYWVSVSESSGTSLLVLSH